MSTLFLHSDEITCQTVKTIPHGYQYLKKNSPLNRQESPWIAICGDVLHLDKIGTIATSRSLDIRTFVPVAPLQRQETINSSRAISSCSVSIHFSKVTISPDLKRHNFCFKSMSRFRITYSQDKVTVMRSNNVYEDKNLMRKNQR